MKNICILGATGSVGTQTLDVIRNDSESFKLISVSANNNYKKIIEIIKEFHPKYIAMMEDAACKNVSDYCRENNENIEVLHGIDGLCAIASVSQVDIVVTSIVGMIGLRPTLAAIRAKKDIALANKETLVVAGDMVIKEAADNKVRILPVDSEHGAIFQCLNGEKYSNIKNILLTASGGPFRGKKLDDLKDVSINQALAHPRWNMGKKISIDSATLMNKGLEVIEAHHLFNAGFDNIKVIVHPQSIIHSMVEFRDGSIIAQMTQPDMRLPIQYALNYPVRKEAIIKGLDFYQVSSLTFEKPDMDTFKCLKLSFQAGKAGGLMTTILNSANEEAVAMFLNKEIKFLDIGNITESCLDKFENGTVSIESILEMDIKVRSYIKNHYRRY
ncbi:MAG: 1-deoxy-D-xylulose-5-phosphate reductoisomerase [Bacillota bacterium]|nr:1-deoxy-D-xylulose-5-phosphate reductoisomerase [Bacillota bacterium]